MSDRRPRRQRGLNSKKLGALAELKEGRKTGVRRSAQHVIHREEDVYMEVDDQEYNEIVASRRDEEFVEEDDDGGYAARGEEEDWSVRPEFEGAEEQEKPYKEKKRKKQQELSGFDKKAPKISRKGGEAPQFNKLTPYLKPPSAAPAKKTSKIADVDLGLGGMLDEFTADPTSAISPSLVSQVTSSRAPASKKKRTEQHSQRPPVKQVVHEEEEEEEEEVEKNVFEKKEEQEEKELVQAEENDNEWWETVQENMAAVETNPTPTPIDQPSSPAPMPLNAAPLPHVTFEGKNVVRFYMIDAWTDEWMSDGVVFLFGKIWVPEHDTHQSICVKVSNIYRRVFILPSETIRRQVDESDDEGKHGLLRAFTRECVTELRRNGIKHSQVKLVRRKYAFEDMSIPRHETDWLKVIYPYSDPRLPDTIRNESIGAVFGRHSKAMEHFLVGRGIMGPSWLHIHAHVPTESPTSWCRYEVCVDDPKAITIDTSEGGPPPITVMSLHALPVVNHRLSSNDVVCVAGVVHHNVAVDGPSDGWEKNVQRFTAVRKLDGSEFPHGFAQAARNKALEVCSSERVLLNYVLAKIHRVDPDVIVGHNFIGYDLDILLHRMQELKIARWSRLGRLKRKLMPKLQSGAGGVGDSTFAERQVMSGRLMCDTYLASKDLVRAQNYSLAHLSATYLDHAVIRVEADDIAKHFHTIDDLFRLTDSVGKDTYLSLALCFKLQILPLTKQLTCLAGNLWSKSLVGARADRNEHLLLHSFHADKYVVPDSTPITKTDKTKGRVRSKAKYSGGLVLEPKKGLYDKFVLLLDFLSLYPSIIQEFNIDFTTVDRPIPDQNGDVQPASAPPPITSDDDMGKLPKLLRSLVVRRQAVKKMIKDESKKQTPDDNQLQIWDVRQRALKLTANSMYGCLGFAQSRFYAKPLAELVTSKGREILLDSVEIAEQELGLEVVYGDTDSIMVNTMRDDLAQVKTIGQTVMAAINKKYRKLEIEIDGVFSCLLLLKKKKYAALMVQEHDDGTVTNTREVKGLDQVRRDWCSLSKKVSDFVLDQILSGNVDREEVVHRIHDKLTEVAADMANNRIALSDYIITKGLTKAPGDYEAKGQPHVQVALRKKKSGLGVRVGDHIEYIICKETLNDREEYVAADQSVSFAMRAFSPDEVSRAKAALTVDTQWYLSQQIHPPVDRLCAPIEGTDSAHLASCLGLDVSKFVHVEDRDDYAVTAYSRNQLSDEERFKSCEPLTVTCPACHVDVIIRGVVRDKSLSPSIQCVCGHVLSESLLLAALRCAIQHHCKRYMDGWMKCDDSSCGKRTRSIKILGLGRQCVVPECTGTAHIEYCSEELYTQLKYFEFLFDSTRNIRRLPADVQERAIAIMTEYDDMFMRMREYIATVLSWSAYNIVDLRNVFRFIHTTK